jgi:hypothetical protein
MAKKKMSDEHKRALAKGREQARAVRDYLEALERDSKPGRRLSKDELEQKVHQLQEQISAEDDPAKRVELVQKRLDYEERLADFEETADIEELQKAFVKAVGDYSERKGISYTAWRELGVPAAVLREAGVPRTRRPRT